jgi:hypothetical protein
MLDQFRRPAGAPTPVVSEGAQQLSCVHPMQAKRWKEA